MIYIFAVLWVIAGIICAGVMTYLDPFEWEDEPMLVTFIGLTMWWLMALLFIACSIINLLSHGGQFVYGFLTGLNKKSIDKYTTT